MTILVVTPDATGAQGGNRRTAVRWAGLLRGLGHRVRLAPAYTGQRCDVLVALHARRSADSVRRFRRDHPAAPLVLALTGTDLYADLSRSAAARQALRLASALVVLQPLARRRLPPALRPRTHVIVQSARAPAGPRPRRGNRFQVCQLAHLRPVKDPLRAALALRHLPATSRIVLAHAGAALDRGLERRARAEQERNPRYRWLGGVRHHAALRLLARSRLLVLASRLEGGANVICEAAASGVPVVASRVEGTVGLLGARYPGYFPVGDTRALARLLWRAESDARFRAALHRGVRALAPRVRPAAEARSWRRLLQRLAP
ncbi:MAG TPA: selenoneine biosynthesis selenosugar synthase SenB [Vicinamibacteria bacterium]|nr:selenoneine biosynthesis selenosugar synthase SenB [Vicinamibacteria bacterium]